MMCSYEHLSVLIHAISFAFSTNFLDVITVIIFLLYFHLPIAVAFTFIVELASKRLSSLKYASSLT